METKSDDFASCLRYWMSARNVNDADLARRVFGTMIDERGYVVARNRQLIGRYKIGKIMPKPATQKAIFDALDLTKDAFFLINGHSVPPDERKNGGITGKNHHRTLTKVLLSDGPQPGTQTLEISAVLDEESTKQILSILMYGQTSSL